MILADNMEFPEGFRANGVLLMKNRNTRKTIGLAIDFAMYAVMLLQMLYVVTGNAVHEWLGISFFALLVCHIVIKRSWFRLWLRRKGKLLSARRFADLMIVLLMVSLILLSFSSMGVSRLLFPKVTILGSPLFHRTLATLALTFAVIHGGMHLYFRAKSKIKAAAVIALLSAAALGIGFGLVPYMNRHYRPVEVHYAEAAPGRKLHWKGSRPLVVYFTRVGNTDFEDDIDAVSGASLLRADGELWGNTQFMAAMLQELMDCDTAAITLTGTRYPSSYADTCTVGGKELKDNARPEILPIDITGYDDILLVYPIWWGTLPMPAASFLESADFAGKTVHLIATQGSSGFVSSTGDIRALIPAAEVIEGISVYCDDIPNSAALLEDWLISAGLAE